MAASLEATVVGGGVGGLATVLALQRSGLDAHVFERRGNADDVQSGTGLTMWTNAVKALRVLGLGDAITAAGTPMHSFEQRSRRGGLLASWPIGEIADSLGAPTVNLTRAELHRVLSEAVDPALVGFKKVCTGIEQTSDSVTTRFSDGSERRSGLLIGADGINSTVRRSLQPQAQPRFAGYVAWRGIAPFEHDCAPRHVFQQFWGPGRRFGFYHVDEHRVYWIAVANASEGADASAEGTKEVLLKREGFGGWGAPVGELISATDESAILRTDIADLDPLTGWSDGRVTLLGDAAHAMSFNVGQGACQAIEDAVVLSKCLTSSRDVPAALHDYEQQRIARTSPMMVRARRIGKMAQWRRPPACALRDQLWRRVIGPVGAKGQRTMMAHEV